MRSPPRPAQCAARIIAPDQSESDKRPSRCRPTCSCSRVARSSPSSSGQSSRTRPSTRPRALVPARSAEPATTRCRRDASDFKQCSSSSAGQLSLDAARSVVRRGRRFGRSRGWIWELTRGRGLPRFRSGATPLPRAPGCPRLPHSVSPSRLRHFGNEASRVASPLPRLRELRAYAQVSPLSRINPGRASE